MSELKDITKDEWEQYKWIEVQPGQYIKGVKLVPPPDDGYIYHEVTTLSDTEQKWERSRQWV